VSTWLGAGPARAIVALLAFTSVAAVVFAVLSRALAPRTRVDDRLRPYSREDERSPAKPRELALAETAVVQRAVAATGRLAARRRLLPAMERLIERAALPLRPEEAVFFYAAAVIVAPLLALVASRSAFVTVVVLLMAAVGVPQTVKLKAAGRRRALLSQFPDVLRMLASSLRSGYSLAQALTAVAEEAPKPMADELARVVSEVRLGGDIEDAIRDMGDRMASADCGFVATAIGIQRQVGGNLAEVLTTVAETIVVRDRLRREARALTAEGRASAVTLALLPVGLGLAFYVLDREYISLLFEDALGQKMLIGSVVLAVVGFVWMRKALEVEV
jgi:tight adherence protein B